MASPTAGGDTVGYLHRLGRSEQHTPASPMTPAQHRRLTLHWNPSMAKSTTDDKITKVVEGGAFRLQIRASRGVRYEQPLSLMMRYSALVREWAAAEGLTVGPTEEEAPQHLDFSVSNVEEKEVPSPTSQKGSVKLSSLAEDENNVTATAAASDYLCKYDDESIIILRTARLTPVSETSPTLCAPINLKKPLAVFRLEVLVGPSDRPKNVQQSDMAGELMLDSQFLGMMFNHVKRFYKAQCENAATMPILPILLQQEGSAELLPGQKKKICQIVEVLGLWEIFDEVHARFRKELAGGGGGGETNEEPDRESEEPADEAERRGEDVAETAKLVEKTMLIAKAKAGVVTESDLPGAATEAAKAAATSSSALQGSGGRTVKEQQEHLEWVESFRNKVKALNNFDSAYEDKKDARMAALKKGPATAATANNNDDSDSDDDGMSAMLLGVGCPLCGRQGHSMGECPYSQ